MTAEATVAAPGQARPEAVEEASPCRSPAHERRVMCRALTQWHTLREGDEPPPLGRVDPLIDPALAPHLYVVRLSHRVPESVFTYCGPVLAELCAADPVGRTADTALPPGLRGTMIDYFKSVARYRQPLADAGSFLVGSGREILYRHIVMPLRDPGGDVGALLGAFSYRMVP